MDAVEKNDVRVTLLGEDNYTIWKWQITSVLELKGLLKCVLPLNDGGEECKEMSTMLQAKTLLASTLSSMNMQRVINCRTAREIWAALETFYENKSSTEKTMLLEQFTSYKIHSVKDISKALGDIQARAARLTALGASIDDGLIISIILKALPDALKSWKNTWKMIHAVEPKLNDLITGIMAEVNDLRTPEDTALVAQNSYNQTGYSKPLYQGGIRADNRIQGYGSRGRRARGTDGRARGDACNYCKKPGHWARDCRKKRYDQERSDPAAAMVAVDGSKQFGHSSWIADSGCSMHMTPESNWLQEYQPLTIEKQITLGDNRSIQAKGSGIIYTSFGILKDVYYVPDLSSNLFSISAATRNGIEAHYDHKGISLTKRGRKIIEGRQAEGVYILDIKINATEKALAATVGDWHKLLAHASPETIKRMAEIKAADDLRIIPGKTDDVCSDCALNKCKRSTHPRKTTAIQENAGSSLHFDTVGPFKEMSLGGSKYILLCKDEASAYRFIRPVASKSTISNEVKMIIAKAELETGNKVLRIVSDNGSEIKNISLTESVKEKGIVHKFSVPYTPEQNGYIEREVRTVIEAARTILNRSKLPKELWAEAANTAVYILNRILHSGNDRTPYELWFGRKPSLKNLHEFGECAVVFYHDSRRSKWDNKGVKQRFVGYTDTFNTFKFYNPSTGEISNSCDVKFLGRTESSFEKQRSYVDVDSNEIRGHYQVWEPDFSWDTEDFRKEEQKTNEVIDQIDMLLDQNDYANDTNLSDVREENEEHDIRNSSFQTAESTGANLTGTEDTVLSEEVQRAISPIKHARRDHVKDPREKVKPSDIHPGHILSSRTRSYNRKDQHTQTKYHAKLATIEADYDPKSYSEAVTRQDKEKWIEAMNEEIDSLKKNNVWMLVDRPKGNIVTNKWVYKVKRNPDGNVERYKARLVARGFSQVYGIDYTDTYAPVANTTSIRMLFAFAAMNHLEMGQFDVKTAFLYGELDETVFMEQPEGYCTDKNKVCLLKRSLYGLKQAPRQWNKKFSDFLHEMNLETSAYDGCIFFGQNPWLIIAIYVDDGLILAKNRSDIDYVLNQLQSRFEVHNLALSTFLGFQIRKAKDGSINLHQESYIKTILKRFNMDNCQPINCPLTITKDLRPNLDTFEDNSLYRGAIGSLMYAAVTTRIDIAHAVSKASRNVEKPTETDWIAVKRIFRYLKDKEHYGITYKADESGQMIVYCDSDFAGDTETSRSTSGSVFIFGGGPILWKSSRQPLITLSSTEAEFVSLCSTVKETAWLRRLGIELGFLRDDEPTLIYCDNQSQRQSRRRLLKDRFANL